jgi:hypothetical protein
MVNKVGCKTHLVFCDILLCLYKKYYLRYILGFSLKCK